MNHIEAIRNWGIERAVRVTRAVDNLLYPAPYAERLRELANVEIKVILPFELGGLFLVGVGVMTGNNWLVGMGVAVGLYSGGIYMLDRASDWYAAKTGTL